eukprot:NODE_283_length_1730_cov_56.125390_g254_i0.p1 GENE.NODE_283_length_1730_cov_56.125390_g254_i0~~NODE_283_length_1730_cov_56.125390_g254_i0.p1  ORF type:complete len:365 (+),score=-11.75 NODE_283_length_1730_cov_56.125390_g254_i0:379-1473(+)
MVHNGWIASRNYDLTFFFFPSLLAILAGALAIANPGLVALLWWLSVSLIEGPHIVATFTRTYLDSNERKERRLLLLSSLLLFVPGIIFWYVSIYTSSNAVFELFLGIAAIWSFYHGIRQHYGVMCIYHRTNNTPKKYRQVDAFYIYAMLYSFIVLPLLLHKAHHEMLGFTEPIPKWVYYTGTGGTTLVILITLFYITTIFQRSRENISVKPAIFVLFPTVGLGASMVFFFGFYEPIFPNPVHPEQVFLVIAFMSVISHGFEYLGVVFITNKKRYQNEKNSFLGYIGRKPFIAYAAFVGVSGILFLLNIARGNAPDLYIFDVNSSTAQLFLAIYWGVFFHHYYLDQKIWRMSKNKKLREELELER